MAMELLQSAAGFKMLHVPYKGSSPALVDLVGGHLGFAATSISSATALMHSGKLRALAVTSLNRNPAVPDVPTVAESGYKEFSVVSYYGVLAPAGLPQPVLTRLNSDFNKILLRTEVRSALLAQGLEPQIRSPEEFSALIKADVEKSRQIIATAGIKVE